MHRVKRITAVITIYIVILSVILFSGCRKKASEEIGYGSFEGSVYTNEYFGLKIEFPSDWSIQDNEASQRVRDLGGKILAGDDEKMKAIVKASELQSVNLFLVTKYPLGSPVSFNPNVAAVAEKVDYLPGITRGKDYLFHARKLLESSGLDYAFPEEVYTEEIGGYSFDVMPAIVKTQNMSFNQKYYSTVMKGYTLSFLTTYADGEDEAALKEILATIQKIN